uniref:AP2/ERF domain-containing protein n=1 Tax=Chromera velia CCMP2878 TaxID=1169474 RepID=A0A0G4FB11_9ALVE|eukprot:Cvel_16085.t1-p1 / transcript=Cvel_16085.t1 / gene=Cvel_16085 / organism=Chromera_velia_CCMP2878 / gene_product=hypothetical protein / transcript_product=hypothetical protein / location=Cvel_scaffold1223:12418-16092(-) / protein_length=903 / sequence_SO=supercontig / SO=protein_coding / is_pseudo=false
MRGEKVQLPPGAVGAADIHPAGLAASASPDSDVQRDLNLSQLLHPETDEMLLDDEEIIEDELMEDYEEEMQLGRRGMSRLQATETEETHVPSGHFKYYDDEEDDENEEDIHNSNVRGVYYLDRLHVWRVECCIDGRRAMKNFSVSKWGYEQAKRLAIDWRMEKARNKGIMRQNFSRAEHQSGMKGVNWCTFRKAWVAVARRGGKRTQKYFFAATHGFHEALELAKQFRTEIGTGSPHMDTPLNAGGRARGGGRGGRSGGGRRRSFEGPGSDVDFFDEEWEHEQERASLQEMRAGCRTSARLKGKAGAGRGGGKRRRSPDYDPDLSDWMCTSSEEGEEMHPRRGGGRKGSDDYLGIEDDLAEDDDWGDGEGLGGASAGRAAVGGTARRGSPAGSSDTPLGPAALSPSTTSAPTRRNANATQGGAAPLTLIPLSLPLPERHRSGGGLEGAELRPFADSFEAEHAQPARGRKGGGGRRQQQGKKGSGADPSPFFPLKVKGVKSDDEETPLALLAPAAAVAATHSNSNSYSQHPADLDEDDEMCLASRKQRRAQAAASPKTKGEKETRRNPNSRGTVAGSPSSTTKGGGSTTRAGTGRNSKRSRKAPSPSVAGTAAAAAMAVEASPPAAAVFASSVGVDESTGVMASFSVDAFGGVTGALAEEPRGRGGRGRAKDVRERRSGAGEMEKEKDQRVVAGSRSSGSCSATALNTNSNSFSTDGGLLHDSVGSGYSLFPLPAALLAEVQTNSEVVPPYGAATPTAETAAGMPANCLWFDKRTYAWCCRLPENAVSDSEDELAEEERERGAESEGFGAERAASSSKERDEGKNKEGGGKVGDGTGDVMMSEVEAEAATITPSSSASSFSFPLSFSALRFGYHGARARALEALNSAKNKKGAVVVEKEKEEEK